MRTKVTLWLAVLVASSLHGEILPKDVVGDAWYAAEKALGAGKSRAEIATELEAVASKHPESWWHKRSMALSKELKASDKRLRDLASSGTPIGAASWAWLAESKMPMCYVSCQPENEKWLRSFMAVNPQDPASLLIAQGRGSIGHLVPLLMDVTPTRETALIITTDHYQIARTSDVALAIVEYLSGCSFCEDKFSQGQFSELPEEIRHRTQHEAEAWWKDHEHSNFSEGIRARFPQAGFYGKVRMARILVRTGQAADQDFVRGELRHLVDSTHGDFSVHAGQVLWDMGDSYALEILRKHFQTRLAEGVFKFIVDSYEVFFLTEHGGRAEWETVVKYADAQLTGGEAGGGQFIWSDIVYSNEAATSPYAIPGLALAVTKGRHSQHGPAPAPTKDGQQLPRHELHVAWKAANLLQRLTGEKFGITDAETSVSEMQASLDKVQSWWEADGRIKFSFDEIERSVGARKTEK